MEETINHEKELMLQRIANHLIISTCNFPEAGLYHGKMGIVLFFAHYARYTRNSIYDDFAGELLDDIFEEIDEDLAIHFESGLCGIGWAIEYLLQNGFMEGNSDEILWEIDKKVMERNLLRVKDNSVKTGLTGLSYYITKRLHSSYRDQQTAPFDEKYLQDWALIKEPYPLCDDNLILSQIWQTTPSQGDIWKWKLGLDNGCAGYGMKILLT